jgi:putative oxidoreductase
MTMGYVSAVNLPFPLLAYIVAIAIEIGGRILPILGFQTRLAGAVLTVFCVAAAVGFHGAFSDPNQTIHFLKSISMAGGQPSPPITVSCRCFRTRSQRPSACRSQRRR